MKIEINGYELLRAQEVELVRALLARRAFWLEARMTDYEFTGDDPDDSSISFVRNTISHEDVVVSLLAMLGYSRLGDRLEDLGDLDD